jgi:hypothetical protein
MSFWSHIGWFRSEWIDREFRRVIPSAWHFYPGGRPTPSDPWNMSIRAVCGYSPLTPGSEWSPEPDPAKLTGRVCARCRRILGR